MNIKQLALKIYSEEDKTLEIDVRDEGEVTASDITHDSDVEILNPELKIATVSKGGHLKIRLVANKGRGYALAEQNNTSDLPIGVIPVDSLYSPVERVNYTVENTRVGQSSDFDKLTLDVWTNGSITPQESVSLAAKIMTEHLNIFVGLTDEAQNAEIMIEKKKIKKKKY
ncbi:DNA-directed RNA polymerase alpha subunit [Staphylococcus aureus]|uniref:DNA-directed RNA polymerase alpha subunit n=1 Tax=Staphylococcus aureus TaxID=1280 RepID=A0A380ELI6_STAAU|nr:DNA-directed RNA polymerase alpha subunit [Staphylococcus aureus]